MKRLNKDPIATILILSGVVLFTVSLLAVATLLFGSSLSGCTRLPTPSPSVSLPTGCCSSTWPGSKSVAVHTNVRATAYYPDSSPMEGGFMDRKGAPLKTVSAYLAGNADAVTVAMDSTVAPYGTKLCSPEMNASQIRPIPLELKDTGGAFQGRGWNRIDFCVKNYGESIRSIYNRTLTLERCE